MGKGDKRRPMKVSSKEYSDNWDKIFNKKSGRVSSSEQILDKDSKFETTVGVLFHPEDPNLMKKESNKSVEIGGRPSGEPEPTRYGDWEKSGRCIDF
tara:strand:+ start:85 stop:375 length:291 start_codon:yes stop_codon:yes gene_type:complete